MSEAWDLTKADRNGLFYTALDAPVRLMWKCSWNCKQPDAVTPCQDALIVIGHAPFELDIMTSIPSASN